MPHENDKVFYCCDCNPLQSFFTGTWSLTQNGSSTHPLPLHSPRRVFFNQIFVNQILLLNFDGCLKHLQICMFDSNLPTASSNFTLDVKVKNDQIQKSTSSNLKKTQLITLQQSFKNSTLIGICLNMGTIDIYGPKQQYIF